MITRVQIDRELLKNGNRSFHIDLLNLPTAILEGVIVNDVSVDRNWVTNHRDEIEISPEAGQLESVVLLIKLDSRKIEKQLNSSLVQRNGAVVIALIGLVGTILATVLKPEFIREIFAQPDITKVVVEPDTYGADPNLSYFQSIIRWGEPNEKNYVFPPEIFNTHKGWYFLRLRENLISIREAEVQNVVGPVEIKNGTMYSQKIPAILRENFCNSDGSLQLIFVALPDGMKLNNGSKISDYGDHAKVLLSPASGSKAGCANS
jgi:hypothetical protein